MRSGILSLFLRLVMGRLAWLKVENAVRQSEHSYAGDEILSEFRNLRSLLHSVCVQGSTLAATKITWSGRQISACRKERPRFVRFLDRKFSFGEESHCDYLPYTAEAEADLRSRGETFMIVELSYSLKAEVY